MNKSNLKDRTYRFSLQIIDFLEKLPNNYVYQIIGKQLLRSATSIGANIVEAQAGRTRRDFINYYHIALKSANETNYWLYILEAKLKSVNDLLQESIEINKMIGASLITLKGKRNY